MVQFKRKTPSFHKDRDSFFITAVHRNEGTFLRQGIYAPLVYRLSACGRNGHMLQSAAMQDEWVCCRT